MTVRSGSLLALLALAFGVFDCAVYSDALLGQGGAVDPAGGSASGDSTAGKGQGGGSGSVVSSAGNDAVAGGGGDIGLGSAGDDSSIAGNGGDAGNPSGGSVALGGMTSSGGAGKGGTAGNGGSNASGGTSGNAGSTSGGAGKGGSAGTAGTAGTSGSAGMSNTAGTGGTAGSGGTSGTAGSAGSAGTAGGSTVPKCSDHVLTARATWSASASTFHVNEPASYLIDNTKTRWTTGVAQAGTEWIQIDFGASVAVRGINLQQGVDANDYPRSYAVIVSDVAKDLTGTVRASGVGSSTVTTTITLPSVFSGRYLLIKQLGTSLSWWSVEEVEVSCFD